MMAIKRKEKDDLSGAATLNIKKTWLSATLAALVAALHTPLTPTPQPFTEAKVPALATRISTVEVKAPKKNPFYGFGKSLTNEGIIKALETCIHPGVPLHTLVHPDAAKLYESVKVYFLSLFVSSANRSRIRMIFSLPIMCSGRPFLSIKEDVPRICLAICSPNFFQRMQSLLGRQMRKQWLTERSFEKFMVPFKRALSLQPMHSLTNGFRLPLVLNGSLVLTKRGTSVSQFNWWDKEGEEVYSQHANWRNLSTRFHCGRAVL